MQERRASSERWGFAIGLRPNARVQEVVMGISVSLVVLAGVGAVVLLLVAAVVTVLVLKGSRKSG